MNTLIGVNGAPYSAYYAGLLFPQSGEGFPYTLPTIEQDVSAKRLGEGDIILCEDAGDVPQPFNPDDYMVSWVNRLTTAKSSGARVLAMTMWDTSQPAWQALNGLYGAPPADSRFDVASLGSPSGISRSPNQCIRDAAAQAGAEVYDFAAAALAFATWCRGEFLLRVTQPDWIHNNLWLDIVMSYGILKHLGLEGFMPTNKALEAIVLPNWSAVGYNCTLPTHPFVWQPTHAASALAEACT